jgi:hypothetical protein
MFTKLVTNSRGALLIAATAASIGMGAILAPTASAQPLSHQCDRLIKSIGVYTNAAEMFRKRGDLDSYLYYYNEAGLAQRDANAAGCGG